MIKYLNLTFVLILTSFVALAQDRIATDEHPSERDTTRDYWLDNNLDSLEASLDYQYGAVTIRSGVTIDLGNRFKYLSSGMVNFVYNEVLNRPNAPVGSAILFRIDDHFMSDYVAEIRYVDSGYVKQEDLNLVDMEQLMLELQTNVGLKRDSMRAWQQKPEFLVGWYQPPNMDTIAHRLTWAKQIRVDGEEDHDLEFEARVLGRSGYIVFSMRGKLSQAEKIKSEFEDLLNSITFEIGEKYSDFKPCCDPVHPLGSNYLLGPIDLKPASFIDRNWKWMLAVVLLLAILIRRRYAARRKQV